MNTRTCTPEALAELSAFGIAVTLPRELVEYSGLWALPVPATYVIDTRGIIHYACVEPDHRKRPNPADVLLAVGTTAWVEEVRKILGHSLC